MWDWCMMGCFFFFGVGVRRVVSFLMLQNKTNSWRVGEKKKKSFVYTHTLHPSLLKNNTRSHGSAFCCDFFFYFYFLICQHELRFQLQMASEIESTTLLLHAFAICFWLFLKKKKNHFLIYFIFFATKASLHGLECPALFCLCVGVCRFYGGQRADEHVKKWMH